MEKLIADYMGSVAECLDMFERKIGRRDILKAAAEGVIARSGELADGVQYKMHGVGCLVEYPDHDVDFDFATPEGDVGFDAWRLWSYAEQHPEKYPEYQERAAVEAALAECLSEGAVGPFENNERLLRWVESAKAR